MPGGYAHITLVNNLCRPQYLNTDAGFASEVITALANYLKYCELGAVSPDYPYLEVESSGAKKWADIMHYEGNGDMIKTGIETLKGMAGEERDICLAWLMGFASHVGMDTTVHPVVEKIVGDYDHHPTEHRICEMNQDVYIFRRMNLEGVAVSEHIEQGIRACDIDAVAGLWGTMLQKTHPGEYTENPPGFNAWHHHFEPLVEDIAAHGYKLVLFGRHTLAEKGFFYPDDHDINESKFIQNLPTPEGKKGYDKVFDDYAAKAVTRLWLAISDGVFKNGTGYQSTFGNWNLDRGITQADAKSGHGKYIFWEGSL